LVQDYELAAAFKVTAAIGAADEIIEALFRLLEDSQRETTFWNCAYWVPTLLRRIERDPDVGDTLIEAIAQAPSASTKISLLALAGRGSKGRVKHHSFFAREAERIAAAVAPPAGFDVTSVANRLALHVVHELLT
jgi:hypothetical protein